LRLLSLSIAPSPYPDTNGFNKNVFATFVLHFPEFSTVQIRKWQLSLVGLVHTTTQEFENRGFTLKTHQMFSLHTTPEEFENATITGHFGFVFV